ncbi:MAG: hypothetical protein QXI93_05215, partial [Candidatus Methanomethylicia archaeon]
MVKVVTFIMIIYINFLSLLAQEKRSFFEKPDNYFFIENKGQWHEDVLYLCRLGGLDAWITKYGVNYTFYRIEQDNRITENVIPESK